MNWQLSSVKTLLKKTIRFCNCEIRKAGYNIPPPGECLYESSALPLRMFGYSHQLTVSVDVEETGKS